MNCEFYQFRPERAHDNRKKSNCGLISRLYGKDRKQMERNSQNVMHSRFKCTKVEESWKVKRKSLVAETKNQSNHTKCCFFFWNICYKFFLLLLHLLFTVSDACAKYMIYGSMENANSGLIWRSGNFSIWNKSLHETNISLFPSSFAP